MPRQHSLEEVKAALLQKQEFGPSREGPSLTHALAFQLSSQPIRQEQQLPFWGGREVGTPEYHVEK